MSEVPVTADVPALAAGLYVVGTPIGNLEDLTLRAIRVLGEVSLIYAEDTRRTRALLSARGIHVVVRSLPAFAEERRTPEIVGAIASGQAVALCTDAGMPGVSDPGAATVRAVRDAGQDVTVIPGVSAVATAVAGSGFGGGPFTFVGFPPRSPGKLRRTIGAALELGAPVVFFEAAVRLPRTLRTLDEVIGERNVVVARELTKRHETWHRGTIAELVAEFTTTPPRGECTVVVDA